MRSADNFTGGAVASDVQLVEGGLADSRGLLRASKLLAWYEVRVYRNDEAARAACVASLVRKAAHVAALEDRIRGLEAENRELEAENRELRAARLREPAPDVSGAEVRVDWKVKDYAAALIKATDPRCTDGPDVDPRGIVRDVVKVS